MPTAAPTTERHEAIVVRLDDYRAHHAVPALDPPAAPARIVATVTRAVAGSVSGAVAVPRTALAMLRMLRA